MEILSRLHPAGFPVFSVLSGENEFELTAFGGQLLSWTKGGVPILFSNRSKGVLDGRMPYRGGAPICFPIFGRGVLMPLGTELSPQHGTSRTSVWSAEIEETALVFRTDQPSPEGYGPTTFSCEIRYEFRDDLRIGIDVTNVGENACPFQLAVHSYWACESPGQVEVRGLGSQYLDNLAGLAETIDIHTTGRREPPFDRVYLDSEENQIMITDQYRLDVATTGCSGSVLWNPGLNHSIADLGSTNFVCLESGIIVPARDLVPGERAQLTIEYRVTIT